MTDPDSGSLEETLIAFARLLRSRGLSLGPGDVTGGIEALSAVDLTDKEDFRLALRSTFSYSRRGQEIFDRCFDWYFGGRALNRDLGDPSRVDGQSLPQPKEGLSLLSWNSGKDLEGESGLMSYSPLETLLKKDFGQVDEEEMRRLEPLVKSLVRRLATRLSRRRMASRQGQVPNLRRSLRRNLGSGGELFQLLYKQRRREKADLVLVLDVSGSMELYGRFLFHLGYLFTTCGKRGRVETFAFSTELYRLSGALRRRGVRQALRKLRLSMPRRGGTRIGFCLESLLDRHRQCLGPKTTVVILSDGWDTGELDVLRKAMSGLKQSAGRILWLNPLAGTPGYEPTAAGMKVVLPYLDVLAPAHNLESLRELDRYLAVVRR